jgi:hypothetical protein
LIINFETEFLQNRERTINKILDFLDLKQQNLNLNVYSNKSSSPRLMWVKRLIQKKGCWRDFAKIMLPSLRYRQFIKNKLQTLNLKEVEPSKLSSFDKKEIFEMYFKKDVLLLEKLIDKQMNWE